MFCENCGNELPDGVRYCSKCGTRVTAAGTGTKQKAASQKGKGGRGRGAGAPAILWVLLAVGIGAGAAAFGRHMLFGGGRNQKDKGMTVAYETQRQEPETSGKKEEDASGTEDAAGTGAAMAAGGTAGEKRDRAAGERQGASEGTDAEREDAGKAETGMADAEKADGNRAPAEEAGAGWRDRLETGPLEEPRTEPETAGENRQAAVSDSRFILPGSDSRYIDVRELENFTVEQCRLARNEIYARHGRRFNDEELQAYFDSQDWYAGTVAPENFRETVLNEYELYNRDLIVKYEEQHGYR